MYILSSTSNIVIGFLYRSPDSPNPNFWNTLDEVLCTTITSEQNCVILIGDINTLIGDSNSMTTAHYVDCVAPYGLNSFISLPTQVVPGGSCKLIDHAFSNISSHITDAVLLSDITDHYPVFFSTNCRSISFML